MCNQQEDKAGSCPGVGEGHRRGSKLVLLLVSKQAKPQLMGGEPWIFAQPWDKKTALCQENSHAALGSRHP